MKPFLSLARLNLYPQEYWRGDFDIEYEEPPFALNGSSPTTSSAEREAINELNEARKITEAILQYNAIEELPPLKNILLEDEVDNIIGWIEPELSISTRIHGYGKEGSWYEAGEELVKIPKFPCP